LGEFVRLSRERRRRNENSFDRFPVCDQCTVEFAYGGCADQNVRSESFANRIDLMLLTLGFAQPIAFGAGIQARIFVLPTTTA
jgi:hypothetical protein